MNARPAFVTFTGVDDLALAKGMRELSTRYPVEWGVLIDSERHGIPLFPDDRQIDRFRGLGVRLCAHLCGDIARRIVAGDMPALNLAGFSRIQVNHGRQGADAAAARAVGRYAARHGVRGVLQCNGPFPAAHTEVDWLFDVSFGEGTVPESFPPVEFDHPFCGYSGGIAPANVADLLASRVTVAQGRAFWVDMESGVRGEAGFDLQKCAAVCRAVYG